MDVNVLANANMLSPIDWLFTAYLELHEKVFGFVMWAADTLIAALPVFAVVLIVTLLGCRWLASWARHALWTLVLIRLIVPVSFVSPVSAQRLWSVIDIQETPQPFPSHRMMPITEMMSAGDASRMFGQTRQTQLESLSRIRFKVHAPRI